MYGIASLSTLDIESSGTDIQPVDLNETVRSAQMDINDNETLDIDVHNASPQNTTLEPSQCLVTNNKVIRKEIMFTGLSELSQGILSSTIKVLGNSILQNDKHVTSTTTHMIVSVDENMLTKRTMKYMEALGRGLWIVSWNCIL